MFQKELTFVAIAFAVVAGVLVFAAVASAIEYDSRPTPWR